MIRRIMLCALALVTAHPVHASPVADSILALTRGARVKLVWERLPWCDSNYNPIPAYFSGDDQNFEGGYAHCQLVVFDTDSGKARILDSTLGYHVNPRITRKDGGYVLWWDKAANATWIRDFAGRQPRRKLLTGTSNFLVSCRYDRATDSEFVYVETTGYANLSCIPLKSDGTLDETKRRIVYNKGNCDDVGSASENGLYIGSSFPWPNTGIYDVAKGTVLARHADGSFGCQPNIAADNSYRFFHLRDDHRAIRMWDANLSTSNWDVTVNAMPGNTSNHDAARPRWTNHVRFLTASYPLTTGYCGNEQLADMSAAQVRTADASKAGTFCFGMFSADFHRVEKWVRVSDGDIRHRDAIGDAWVALTTQTIARRTSRAISTRVQGGNAETPNHLWNLQGQLLRKGAPGSDLGIRPVVLNRAGASAKGARSPLVIAGGGR